MPSRSRREHPTFDHAGLIGGTIMRHPREFVALFMASLATLWIVINALFLQHGPHPAPIFAAPQAAAPLTQKEASLPSHRPAQITTPEPPAPPAARSQAQVAADIQRELRRLGSYGGEIDGIWGSKTAAAARDFVQASHLTLKPEPSEDLLRAAMAAQAKTAGATALPAETAPGTLQEQAAVKPLPPSKRMIAVQRALAEFGYGQIKPTGLYDDATRAAIENFQRDHKLPVDGQLTERFTRELAAMTGRALDN